MWLFLTRFDLFSLLCLYMCGLRTLHNGGLACAVRAHILSPALPVRSRCLTLQREEMPSVQWFVHGTEEG